MLSRRPSPLCAIACASALTAMGACFVSGFELDDGVGGGGQASTHTGGADGGGGSGLGCGHARWPSPTDESDPGGSDVDFVVAARSIDFGEVDLSIGPTVGYDLDGRCTCQGEDDSCREPDWATADHCDGPAGRDNAVAQLFHELGTFDADFTSAQYTDRAERGRDSLLLRVRAYNGLANDDEVTVSLHPSQGTDDDPCNPSGTEASWDGSDIWPINAASLNEAQGGAGGGGGAAGGGGGPPVTCGPNGHDIDDARYQDVHAYVNDWTLVANLPEAAIEFTSGDDSLPVQLEAGFVTGRLELQGGLWSLREGLLVGRWTLAEFFKMIGNITSQHQPLCTDHLLYPMLKEALCLYPDIASDLPGPTTPCDALSFGIAIDAYQAQIGSVLAAIPLQRLCPTETDPIYDSCEPE